MDDYTALVAGLTGLSAEQIGAYLLTLVSVSAIAGLVAPWLQARLPEWQEDARVTATLADDRIVRALGHVLRAAAARERDGVDRAALRGGARQRLARPANEHAAPSIPRGRVWSVPALAALSVAACALLASGCGMSTLERHTMAAGLLHGGTGVAAQVIEARAQADADAATDEADLTARMERWHRAEAAQRLVAAAVDVYVAEVLAAAVVADNGARPDEARLLRALGEALSVYRALAELLAEYGVELPSVARALSVVGVRCERARRDPHRRADHRRPPHHGGAQRPRTRLPLCTNSARWDRLSAPTSAAWRTGHGSAYASSARRGMRSGASRTGERLMLPPGATFEAVAPHLGGAVAVWDVSHLLPTKKGKPQPARSPGARIVRCYVHKSGGEGPAGYAGVLGMARYVVARRMFPAPLHVLGLDGARRGRRGAAGAVPLRSRRPAHLAHGGVCNDHGVSLALQGNLSKRDLTPLQRRVAEAGLAYVTQRYELDPVEPIGRHSRAKRYGASKDKTICPGEYGERWLDGWLAGRS